MIHMKRYSLLLILLFAGVITAHSQVQERFKTRQSDSTDSAEQAQDSPTKVSKPQPAEEKFWDKIVIGGNASLSFGTYTFVYLAPSVGYKFSENFVAGPGFIYQYVQLNQAYNYSTGNYQKVEGIKSTVYGPKVFATYFLMDKFLFVGTQFEYLNHDFSYYNNSGSLSEDNIWTPVLFLEAGISTPLGSKGFAQIGLRYNILDDPTSPYGGALFPIIGFYF